MCGRVFREAEGRYMVTLEGGDSFHEFGRAFGKAQSSIRFLVLPGGGIVRQPVSAAEREGISRGIASGSSIREIAKRLDRAVSTVSREMARHGCCPVYRANEADHQAWESAAQAMPSCHTCEAAEERCE
jgi:Helix-turn-helix domain